MKQTLDIKILDTDEGEVAFSKGHHDLQAFGDKVRKAMKEPTDTWQGPWHSYWRQMPGGPDYQGRFEAAEPRQRGAFSVTWMTRAHRVLQ